MTASSQDTSACVIGAGIIGSWAALHLAEAGVKTTLIEQFPLPHTRGSSHGMSRAFRLLGELELGRLDYSFERWQSLEKACGETLFVKTGLLNFGPPGDAELEQLMAVLRAGERPFEWLEAATIAQRYPMLEYPPEWGAAWDPSGGILFAHRCLNAVQAKFKALGGRIITGRVETVDTAPETSVRICLKSDISDKIEEMNFDHAVVCAGPWTAKLLPKIAGLLHSLLTPVTYWRDPTDSYSAANGLPIIFNARLTDVYGLPSCEYPGLVKMLYHGGPEADPNNRDNASFEPFIEIVRRYVREHLPHLEHDRPAILETCMYTMTPDSSPIIDRVEDRLVVGCGFSGSGFKHAPATGQMLAALVLGQEASIPDDFGAFRYRLGRFEAVF